MSHCVVCEAAESWFNGLNEEGICRGCESPPITEFDCDCEACVPPIPKGDHNHLISIAKMEMRYEGAHAPAYRRKTKRIDARAERRSAKNEINAAMWEP